MAQREPERRRDRARPPGRRDRRPARHDRAARARAHRRPVRARHDVLRRRARHRHDPRARLTRAPAELLGLEPDEQLLAHARARAFAARPPRRVRSTFAFGSAPQAHATRSTRGATPRCASGFPPAGPEMVLGVTDRRLLVWQHVVLARPAADDRRRASPLDQHRDVDRRAPRPGHRRRVRAARTARSSRSRRCAAAGSATSPMRRTAIADGSAGIASGHDDLRLPDSRLPARRRGRREMFDRTCARTRIAAEASGFESVWVMDHFWQLPALGGPDEPILEAYTLLGALAARTERVQLGTLVTGVTYRNPALLAKMVTTLDMISQGRAILGIGAAWYEPEHDGLGFDFPARRRTPRPARGSGADLPRDVPRRAPDVRRAATTRSPTRATCPRPLQAGGPPIMIGGQRREAHAAARRAVRRHVQRHRRPGHGRAQARRAARRTAPTSAATRRRSPRPGSARSCSPPTPTRPHACAASSSGLAGDEFDEQFTVGEPDEIVPRRSRRSSPPGVDSPDLQHAALRRRHRRARPASCSSPTSRSLARA